MDAVFEPMRWATRTLARLGMPAEEIASVLSVAEPSHLRRYFELHGERLNEAVTEQLRLLSEVEAVLALEILRDGARSSDGV